MRRVRVLRKFEICVKKRKTLTPATVGMNGGDHDLRGLPLFERAGYEFKIFGENFSNLTNGQNRLAVMGFI